MFNVNAPPSLSEAAATESAMRNADLIEAQTHLSAGATPPQTSRPTPVQEHETRYVSQERIRAARHDRALERACVVLRDARLDSSTQDLVAALLARLPDQLSTDECDLIRLHGDHMAVIYRVERAQNDVGHSQLPRKRRTHSGTGRNVRLESVELQPGQSPLDVLRSSGSTNRIYVFVRGSAAAEPLGILSIAMGARDRMSADDRAFLDALAGVLSAELERPAPGLTEWLSAERDGHRTRL